MLPYNLDAWDGYPTERERVYAAAAGKKLISLAGDTHNAWHSNLTTADGRRAGAEFACSSVSSPGFEALLAGDAAAIAGFEQSNALLIDDLQYLDASRRGYILATFTADSATAEYRYVAGLETENIVTTTGHTVVEA
ncbi:alkaline phosphatase D family protein [Hymenobacter piscis]|uniref:alkaline phosphatase D family protein n=1 Tax=Hymenobacter piscis TaxID=2839984 RepID=UPI003743396A